MQVNYIGDLFQEPGTFSETHHRFACLATPAALERALACGLSFLKKSTKAPTSSNPQIKLIY